MTDSASANSGNSESSITRKELLVPSGDDHSLQNWCEDCACLRQELDTLKSEHAASYTTLKDKIISTDKLIKKYTSKCQECDSQTKKLEDMSKKLEQYKKDYSIVETQLKAALAEVDPLRKTNIKLEKYQEHYENVKQELHDHKQASEHLRQQYAVAHEELEKEKKNLENKNQHQINNNKTIEAKLKKALETNKKAQDDGIKKKQEVTELRRANQKSQTQIDKLETKVRCYDEILKRHGLWNKALTFYKQYLKGEVQLIARGRGRYSRVNSEGEETDPIEEKEEEEKPEIPPQHNTAKHTGGAGGEREFLNKILDEMCGEDNKDLDFVFNMCQPLSPALSPLPPSPQSEEESEDTTANESDGMADAAELLQKQLTARSGPSSRGKHRKARSRKTKLVKSVLVKQGLLELQESLSDPEDGGKEDMPFSKKNLSRSDLSRDLDLSTSDSDDDTEKNEESQNPVLTRRSPRREHSTYLNPNKPVESSRIGDGVFKQPLPIPPPRRGRRRTTQSMSLGQSQPESPTPPDGEPRRFTRSMSCPLLGSPKSATESEKGDAESGRSVQNKCMEGVTKAQAGGMRTRRRSGSKSSESEGEDTPNKSQTSPKVGHNEPVETADGDNTPKRKARVKHILGETKNETIMPNVPKRITRSQKSQDLRSESEEEEGPRLLRGQIEVTKVTRRSPRLSTSSASSDEGDLGSDKMKKRRRPLRSSKDKSDSDSASETSPSAPGRSRRSPRRVKSDPAKTSQPEEESNNKDLKRTRSEGFIVTMTDSDICESDAEEKNEKSKTSVSARTQTKHFTLETGNNIENYESTTPEIKGTESAEDSKQNLTVNISVQYQEKESENNIDVSNNIESLESKEQLYNTGAQNVEEPAKTIDTLQKGSTEQSDLESHGMMDSAPCETNDNHDDQNKKNVGTASRLDSLISRFSKKKDIGRRAIILGNDIAVAKPGESTNKNLVKPIEETNSKSEDGKNSYQSPESPTMKVKGKTPDIDRQESEAEKDKTDLENRTQGFVGQDERGHSSRKGRNVLTRQLSMEEEGAKQRDCTRSSKHKQQSNKQDDDDEPNDKVYQDRIGQDIDNPEQITLHANTFNENRNKDSKQSLHQDRVDVFDDKPKHLLHQDRIEIENDLQEKIVEGDNKTKHILHQDRIDEDDAKQKHLLHQDRVDEDDDKQKHLQHQDKVDEDDDKQKHLLHQDKVDEDDDKQKHLLHQDKVDEDFDKPKPMIQDKGDEDDDKAIYLLHQKQIDKDDKDIDESPTKKMKLGGDAKDDEPESDMAQDIAQGSIQKLRAQAASATQQSIPLGSAFYRPQPRSSSQEGEILGSPEPSTSKTSAVTKNNGATDPENRDDNPGTPDMEEGSLETVGSLENLASPGSGENSINLEPLNVIKVIQREDDSLSADENHEMLEHALDSPQVSEDNSVISSLPSSPVDVGKTHSLTPVSPLPASESSHEEALSPLSMSDTEDLDIPISPLPPTPERPWIRSAPSTPGSDQRNASPQKQISQESSKSISEMSDTHKEDQENRVKISAEPIASGSGYQDNSIAHLQHNQMRNANLFCESKKQSVKLKTMQNLSAQFELMQHEEHSIETEGELTTIQGITEKSLQTVSKSENSVKLEALQETQRMLAARKTVATRPTELELPKRQHSRTRVFTAPQGASRRRLSQENCKQTAQTTVHSNPVSQTSRQSSNNNNIKSSYQNDQSKRSSQSNVKNNKSGHNVPITESVGAQQSKAHRIIQQRQKSVAKLAQTSNISTVSLHDSITRSKEMMLKRKAQGEHKDSPVSHKSPNIRARQTVQIDPQPQPVPGPKKRGRPPKRRSSEGVEEPAANQEACDSKTVITNQSEDQKTDVPPTTRRGPGRPTKRRISDTTQTRQSSVTEKNSLTSPSKRQRTADLKSIDQELQYLLRFSNLKVHDISVRMLALSPKPTAEEICDRMLMLLLGRQINLLATLITECNKMKDLSLWRPILADHEINMVDFAMNMSSKRSMEGFADEFLRSAMKCLLCKEPVMSVLAKSSVCRVVVGILRQQGNMAKARVYAYDLVWHSALYIPSLITNFAAVWPQVLFKLSPDPIIDTLEYIVMKKMLEKKTKNTRLSQCLQKLLQWQVPDSDASTQARSMLDTLKATATTAHPSHYSELAYSITRSMQLLCHFEGWEWTNNVLLFDLLWPTIEAWATGQYSRAPDTFACTLIRITGFAASCCPAWKESCIESVLKTLCGILYGMPGTSVSEAVQMAALDSLLLLGPYNPLMVASACHSWIISHPTALKHHPHFSSKIHHFVEVYHSKLQGIDVTGLLQLCA